MSQNQQTQSIASIKGVMEKWSIVGNLNDAPVQFGPYDTAEKADKTLPVLTDAGLKDAKVQVIYTCSSVSAVAKEFTPKTETTPVSPAPEPEAPAAPVPAAPKGRRSRQTANA